MLWFEKAKMATVGKKACSVYFAKVTPASEEAKEAFLSRLNAVRDLLTPEGSAKVDYYGLIAECVVLPRGKQQSAAIFPRARHGTVLSYGL